MNWKDVFKFELRPLQQEFMEDMISGIEKNPVTALVAPNGFGKTLCTIIGAVCSGYKKTYYTTRTQKQMQNVVRTVGMINEKNGRTVLSAMELAGRDRSCINAKKLAMDTHEDVLIGCSSFKKDNFCTITDNENQWLRIASEEEIDPSFPQKVMGIDAITRISIEHNLCPYYFSRAIFKNYDLVACSYNHVFDPSVRYSIGLPVDHSLIIVDEAHNIVDALESFMTKKITRKMMESALRMPIRFSGDSRYIISRLDAVLSSVATAAKGMKKNFMSMVDFKEELECRGISNKWLSRAMALLKRDDEDNGFLDNVLSFINIIKEEDPEKEIYVDLVKDGRDRFYDVRVSTMNVKSIIDDIVDLGSRIVLLSGTMSPGFVEKRIERNVNIKEYILVKRNLNVYVCNYVPGLRKRLSSYYNSRDDEKMLGGFGQYIKPVLDHVRGGSIAFFPSYDFQKAVYRAWELDGCISYDKDGAYFLTAGNKKVPVFVEKRGNAKTVINEYKQSIDDGSDTLLLSVYRGMASEGEDFPGKYCKAVFCIGLPIRNVTSKSIEYRTRHYDKMGSALGSFWLRWDAMNAVSQAIGRCMRDPLHDKAIALLMDSRFDTTDHTSYLAKWIRDCIKMKGMTSTPDSVSASVGKFFEQEG